jgi:hypothetical protein
MRATPTADIKRAKTEVDGPDKDTTGVHDIKRGPIVLTFFGRRKLASRKQRVAALTVFALAAVLGVGVYAFTASNTVPAHKAGAGAGAVTGYTVASHVSYTWNSSGEDVTAAHFTLNEAASDVQVALTPAAPGSAEDWTDCGATAAVTFEVACEFTKAAAFKNGVPNGEGDKLSVAAVSEGKVVIE